MSLFHTLASLKYQNEKRKKGENVVLEWDWGSMLWNSEDEQYDNETLCESERERQGQVDKEMDIHKKAR